MKRKFKTIKILSLIIIISFFSDKIQAFNNLKSQESENLRVSTIEQIYDEISFIQLDENISEIKKREKISALHKQLSSLGVKDMDASEFIELAGDSNSITPYAFDSAPGPDIINQLNNSYSIKSYITTSYGKRQNHVVFKSKSSDPYLAKNKTVTVFDSFNKGSGARSWINELIKIYAEKVVGSIPIVQWIPYEMLGISKPQENQLSSTGDSLLVTLSTNSTQKFVFVESGGRWHYSLSVNKVSISVHTQAILNINGNVRDLYKQKYYSAVGDYNNAEYLANNNIGRGLNRCIYSIKVHSKSRGGNVISQSIHNPNNYTDMF